MIVRAGWGAMVAVVIGTAGCGEGWYIIRGTVREERDGVSRPLAGVRVHAERGRRGGSDPAVTGEDGTFALKYGFAALPGAGNPDVTFSAAGYQTRAVRLQSDAVDPGIKRTACTRCAYTTGRDDWCCGIDAMLLPSSRPAASPP